MMTVVGLLFVGGLMFIFAWAGVSKIIVEELDKHYRTYKNVDTLYYKELQNLNSRISIMPSFLWEATKLILAIEREERENALQSEHPVDDNETPGSTMKS